VAWITRTLRSRQIGVVPARLHAGDGLEHRREIQHLPRDRKRARQDHGRGVVQGLAGGAGVIRQVQPGGDVMSLFQPGKRLGNQTFEK